MVRYFPEDEIGDTNFKDVGNGRIKLAEAALVTNGWHT
jgi:hypothetical protein